MIKNQLPYSHSSVTDQIKDHFIDVSDFVFLESSLTDLIVIYLETMVDMSILEQFFLTPVKELNKETITPDKLKDILPLTFTETKDLQQIYDNLLRGWTYIICSGTEKGFLGNTSKKIARSFSAAEVESQIIGPQIAFIESLDANLGLLRLTITDANLKAVRLQTGIRTKTHLEVLYIEKQANPEQVRILINRINAIQNEDIMTSSALIQMIKDNIWSIFPQMYLTERPDRVSNMLLNGKIIILVDGSPQAIVAPSTFYDFFQSAEELYSNWLVGMFIRFVRLFAVFISTFLTPIYVAAVTFHYQVIPPYLLVSLAESRSKVPFPPLFEALLLDFIIELLREAGARMPNKVGQTMGVVGGIVIGEAAVQAGFTSNILIMLIALSALASFSSPSYPMSMTLRLIRFPMTILAGLMGGIGIMMGAAILLIHLLRQESVGESYFPLPLPVNKAKLRNGLLRAQYLLFSKQALYNGTDDWSFNTKKKRKQDIDE